MKTRLAVSAFLVLAAVMLAADKATSFRSVPRLPLPVAYDRALKALGQETNEFYCIGGTLTNVPPHGGWHFEFSSTNGEPMWVDVPFAGNPLVTFLEKVRR
jgi:hypothetical protein